MVPGVKRARLDIFLSYPSPSSVQRRACGTSGLGLRGREYLDRVHSQRKWAEQSPAFERQQSGQAHVLTKVGSLTEGYDDMSISCMLMARPTKSTGEPRWVLVVGLLSCALRSATVGSWLCLQCCRISWLSCRLHAACTLLPPGRMIAPNPDTRMSLEPVWKL